MVTRSSRVRSTRTSQPSPQQTRQRRKVPAKSTQRVADEVVGQRIEVSWPSDNTYYEAVVIDYDSRRHQHKVIYLEDETTETMELGTGPGRRGFRQPAPHPDPLVGAEIVLFDDKRTGTQTWFDFMRQDEDDQSPFHVTIYATVSEPEDDEVTGPSKQDEDSRYYRVIHSPNDYLTTLDLSSAKYTIHSQPNAGQAGDEDGADGQPEKEGSTVIDEPLEGEDDSNAKSKSKRETDVDEVVDLDPTADTEPAVDSEPPVPTVRSRSNRQARGGQKKVDVATVDVDDEREFDADPTASIRTDTKKRPTSRSKDNVVDDEDEGKVDVEDKKGKDDDFNPAVIEDTDDETVKPSRSSRRVKDAEAQRVATRGRSTRRPSSEIKVDVDDDIIADPLENDLREAASREKQDGHSKQEAKEEPVLGGRRKRENVPAPVPSKMFPEDFQDEKQHDTASDEEKFGWVPPSGADGDAPLGDRGAKPESRAPENRPQVGDFILLDTGSGGERRKAFVEAYFPEIGNHFVAFCDSRGGNVQIKLTNDNYSLISDSDVEKMTNNEAILPAEEEEEVEPRKKLGQSGSGSKRGRDSLGGSGKKKSLKQYSNQKILGKSAGPEIVSRCVSVLWPGSKLVYVALVMGYSPESRQHILLYMVDHCVETLDLRYREWELLARGTQPWNSSGMVGKRIFVWWPGEYNEQETQDLAERLFGEETKVAYEAYVLAYSGKSVYKIIYPCNEDCEERSLKVENTRDVTEKDWDILEEGVNEVAGLPVIGWEG